MKLFEQYFEAAKVLNMTPFMRLAVERSSEYNQEEKVFLLEQSNEYFFELDRVIFSDFNEGIADKLKSVVDGTKNAIVKVGGKAKEIKDSAIKKIAKQAESLAGLMKVLKQGIKEVSGLIDSKSLKKAFNFDVGKIQSKISDKLEKYGKEKRETLKEEINKAREIFAFFLKKVQQEIKGFLSKGEVKGKIEKSVSESLNIPFYKMMCESLSNRGTENLIMEYQKLNAYINEGEGGSKISSLVHGLAKYPPFSWLNKLQSFFAKNIGAGLNMFAKWIKEEMSGPGLYKFPILSELLGTIAEIKTKDAIKYNILKPIVYFIFPPASVVLSALSNIAFVVALWEALEKAGIVT